MYVRANQLELISLIEDVNLLTVTERTSILDCLTSGAAPVHVLSCMHGGMQGNNFTNACKSELEYIPDICRSRPRA